MIAISLCGPLGVVGAAQPPSALFLRAGDLSVLERIGQNTSETRDPLSGFRRYGFGGTAIPESSVLAFEENELFTMIVGDLDRSKSESGPRLKDDSSRVVRRLFLLKPSTILIDDETRRSTPGKRILWTLQTNGSVKFGNKQVHVSEGDNVYVLQSLRPQPVQVSRAERKAGTSQAGYTVDLAPEGMPSEARFVNVIRVRDSSEKDPLPPTDVSGSAMLRLTVRDNGRMFEFTLPRWREGAGEIRIVAADGKPLVDRRPLASGILPHSVAGVRQIARWNEIYRSPTPPSWDIGRPAIDLVRAVESGLIKPCRAVDLGCGSGTNAIYLAGKGFDVTGIDLSSTALSIAQKKAQQAGVDVHWLLADVLAPPKLAPFGLIFDRGCYHGVRRQGAAAYVAAVRRLSKPDSQILILAGNAKEPGPRSGPPRVSEEEIRGDFEKSFHVEELRPSHFDTADPEKKGTLAWFVLLRRTSSER